MSEIHRDRELEHLESMLYSYKVENKSMDTENERLKQKIRGLLDDISKLQEEAEYRFMYGYDIASADYKDIMEKQDREITKLRAAVEEIYKSSHQVHIIEIARATLGGENG